jgi:hypothetical protein
MSFMKRKFKNQLISHLDAIIWMLVKKNYILEIFLVINLLRNGRLLIPNMHLMSSCFFVILGSNIFVLQ